MLLALDIGNSHMKIGVFRGDDMQYVASMAADARQTGEQYACMLQSILALGGITQSMISGIILSSVVPPLTPSVQDALRLLWPGVRKFSLSSGIRTGLNIRLDQPRALGTDLVANAVWALQGGELPCVVVDLGTVTTFTVLDTTGALVGTAIGAGVKMTLGAIRHCAAQLPSVRLEKPAHGILGRNTVEALKAGAIYGAASMIDGMIDRFAEALHVPPAVWLTGGTAALIAPYLRCKARLAPYATLHGMRVIWGKNTEK